MGKYKIWEVPKAEAMNSIATHEKDINDNQRYTWQAIWALGDYFSQMGASAWLPNMDESEIPLYILCILLEKHDNSFNTSEYIDCELIEAASPIIEKCNSCIQNVSLSSSELISFVLGFYTITDKKLQNLAGTRLQPRDKKIRWQAFGEYLNARNLQQSNSTMASHFSLLMH